MIRAILFALFLLPSLLFAQADRGKIVSAVKVTTFTVDSLAAELSNRTAGLFGGTPLPASAIKLVFGLEYDIDVYKVAYETIDTDSITATTATGVVVVPTNYPCDLALYTYGHGLSAKHREVPSNWNSSIYSFITMGIAANGFVGIAPDYIHMGFDASPGVQAFMHAQSEASATIDMIRATRTICADNSVSLNNQVFLTGYSQGGHSSMATAKEIQANYSSEFNIEAVAPGGGTFDLSGIAADSLASPTRVTGEPQALCLVAWSYMNAYRDTLIARNLPYTELNQVFESPYDSLLAIILNPDSALYNAGQLLDEIPSRMLIDTLENQFRNDRNFWMREFLADNDLYNWAPQMPMRLYHSPIDVENPFDNVLFTEDTMNVLGATQLSVEVMDSISHAEAGFPHILSSLEWIKTFRQDCGVKIQEVSDGELSVYPNPITDNFTINLSQVNIYETINLVNTLGQTVWSSELQLNSTNQTFTLPQSLQKGMYWLVVSNKEHSIIQPIVKQ